MYAQGANEWVGYEVWIPHSLFSAHQIGDLDFIPPLAPRVYHICWCRTQNRHNFEEKHRRCHLNHHLPEVTGIRRLPSPFHLCGCSLVIEGEPSERRKLCDQGQRNILALVLHKDSSRAVSSLCFLSCDGVVGIFGRSGLFSELFKKDYIAHIEIGRGKSFCTHGDISNDKGKVARKTMKKRPAGYLNMKLSCRRVVVSSLVFFIWESAKTLDAWINVHLKFAFPEAHVDKLLIRDFLLDSDIGLGRTLPLYPYLSLRYLIQNLNAALLFLFCSFSR